MNFLGKTYIPGEKPLLADGAWGTELFKRGFEQGDCPEEWNLTHPDDIKSIAEDYARAGSDIILTNTFGGNRIKLTHYGLENKTTELNRIGAELSRMAAGDDVLIAGDMGSTGKLLMMGEVSAEQVYDSYAEQAQALKQGGADCLLIETMTDREEMVLAVEASVKESGLPVIASMTYEKTQNGDYFTIMGNTPEECMKAAANAGAVMAGANCGTGIDEYIALADKLCRLDILPVWIKANSGLPEMTANGIEYRMSCSQFVSHIPELIKAGVAAVGGCCGTTPAFIKETRLVLGS